MLWAAIYTQELDPLQGKIPLSNIVSTILAALPVVALFYLLVPRRWLAPKAGAAGALVAWIVAVLVYRMPADMATAAFLYGAAFGLLPVGWTIFNAMLLYNITVRTGQFNVVKRSVAGLSGDARIQAILIGFAFGAFLEGAAGGGTPVAICGAIMVGLGFNPFLAAVLCLIANTSPVAYGGLGTPLIVLSGVTDIPTETLSTMAGHQLPILSAIVPAYMVRCMCSWRQTWEVWPALLVAGGSFAVFQYTFATLHDHTNGFLVLYPMTDIGGGIFSLVATAIFLKFWKPRKEWHFQNGDSEAHGAEPSHSPTKSVSTDSGAEDSHAAAARAMMESDSPTSTEPEKPLTLGSITLAWTPYALMSVLLLLTGLVRQKEERREGEAWSFLGVLRQEDGAGPVFLGPIQTNYRVPVPTLHSETQRAAKLHAVKMEQCAALAVGSGTPLEALTNLQLAQRYVPRPEGALYNFAWLTAPGSAVFVAALLSMVMLRMNLADVVWVFRRTFFQMKIPIPTIACMLGLSYITRYAGMDATLGIAFAATGMLYPFFAAILGWLGVFLTGTDAGSNALFGSLQKITATEIYRTDVLSQLTLPQAQVLICTANSTGGVMGKMIDAQSICVATAATHQLGKEADIFKAVIWHSIILASIVGLMTLAQAYIWPLTLLVPHP